MKDHKSISPSLNLAYDNPFFPRVTKIPIVELSVTQRLRRNRIPANYCQLINISWNIYHVDGGFRRTSDEYPNGEAGRVGG